MHLSVVFPTSASRVGALCLDKQLISTGGPDRIELCDILTKSGTFIHVKKRGRSSTLSHLFAQGINSAELLLNDQAFLDDARTLVTKVNRRFRGAIPQELHARKQITIASVVLSRSRRTDTPHGLPFFSLVSLQAAARSLRNAGVRVNVQQIREGAARRQP